MNRDASKEVGDTKQIADKIAEISRGSVEEGYVPPHFSTSWKQNDATPMMRQYMNIKKAHGDYLLFYRMGDFYELFFDDAVKASEVLNIALTKRGKHESQDIPMCGVPAHASEYYLNKLISEGFKVAVCEQLETPEEAKKRGYKAVVKREVGENSHAWYYRRR